MGKQLNKSNKTDDTVEVWDLPLRLFHWALVTLVISAIVSANMSIEYMDYHLYIGYGILTLLIFRLFWGIIGSDYAKFGSFIYSPTTVFSYAKALFSSSERRYVGHNPMGSLMVFMMLLVLLTQAVSGLFSSDDIFTEGPLAASVSGSISSWFTSVHHTNIIVLISAIVLHICASMGYWFFKKENLVAPMIHGKKDKKGAEDIIQHAKPKPIWLAVISLLFSASVVFYVVGLG
ncbi:MAG: cytochrome b/b6 domain-containing protein [Pseudomonadales bacterium]|nr:cytochrome b/b6 domain-containing protein [Pseudomonadales bacterium]